MSQPKFVVTPQARQDLLDIWEYIADDSVDNADPVIGKLYDAFARLAQSPGIGHYREDLADTQHRFWNVYSYVIGVSVGDNAARDHCDRSWIPAPRSVFPTKNDRLKAVATWVAARPTPRCARAPVSRVPGCSRVSRRVRDAYAARQPDGDR